MKRIITAAMAGIGMGLLALSVLARAGELDLTIYQGPEGAIHLNRESNLVDPYFATKALLEASHAGVDVRRAAHAWIDWALKRQLPDGRFNRYCRVPPQDWVACADADADDAMMAVWMQLLVELAPPEGMSPAWRLSVQSASRQLRTLFDPGLGIYFISAKQPVGLFMDNVEIYAALRAMARWQRDSGKFFEAARSENEATRLQQQLVNNFWDTREQRFRVSTQPRSINEFYPDEVAQIYPWVENMPTPHGTGRDRAYRQWIQQSGAAWLRMEADHFPWGLVAIAALRMNEVHAECWLVRAAPLRHSNRWNVLEEAIFQALEMRYGTGRHCAVND